MQKKYNVAMFGTGKIAHKISGALTVCENRIIRYGVASRDKSHAEKFAKTNGFQKVYEDYAELLNDPMIDFVYISTPTEMHYEHMKMCLLAGKNVICEKPFALNREQAEELIDLARHRGLICMDAMWSMYMPMWKELMELIDKGTLGDLKFLSASFGYPGLNVPRLFNKDGGGAFYDLGVYCVTVARRVLGNSYHIMNANFEWYQGVDIVNKVKLEMNSCKVRIHSSIKKRSSYLLSIIGTKGMIISRKFWMGKAFYFWKYPFTIKKYGYVHRKNGYEYELEEMINLLDDNRIDSIQWKHEDTLGVVSCMDEIRAYAKR